MEQFPAIAVKGFRLTLVLASVVAVRLLAQVPAAAAYTFEALPRTDAELAKRFSEDQIQILEMLNRRDREHLVRADPPTPGLLVPGSWSPDPLVYSPFPATWPAAEPHPKSIVVDQPMQAFGAYEYGRLVRWGPVSSGRKETPTPEGAFNLTWRARSRRSTDNQDWLLEWYFNFVNARGISFHLFDLPGYPASHACVRLLLRDAQWLYGWGEQWTLADPRTVTAPGTPVVILGTYPFGSAPSWLSLDKLSTPIALPAVLPELKLRPIPVL
jgi:lipoprotein-anchoring transpeptidase ErfK/SrfK